MTSLRCGGLGMVWGPAAHEFPQAEVFNAGKKRDDEQALLARMC